MVGRGVEAAKESTRSVECIVVYNKVGIVVLSDAHRFEWASGRRYI